MSEKSVSIRVQVPMTIGDNIPVLMTTFNNLGRGEDHFAYIFKRNGELTDPALVRVHSSCVTGDIFGSRRCDCGDQLHNSVRQLHREGGALIYMFQEGRGIGLRAKMDAYALQIQQGLDTYEANRALGHGEDERDYKEAAQILDALGIKRVNLITGNPDKVRQLKEYGIEIVSMRPPEARVGTENAAYLAAKIGRGHIINLG